MGRREARMLSGQGVKRCGKGRSRGRGDIEAIVEDFVEDFPLTPLSLYIYRHFRKRRGSESAIFPRRYTPNIPDFIGDSS